jgi:ligand-binding sensor protein
MFLELVIPVGLLTQFSAPKLLLVKKMCQLGRTFLLEMLVRNEHCSAYMPAWYGAFCRESPSHPRGHKRCLSSGKTNGSKSLLWTD